VQHLVSRLETFVHGFESGDESINYLFASTIIQRRNGDSSINSEHVRPLLQRVFEIQWHLPIV